MNFKTPNLPMNNVFYDTIPEIYFRIKIRPESETIQINDNRNDKIKYF